MRKAVLSIAVILTVFSLSALSYGQGAVKGGPDPATIRDAELERDSLHNLEVARMYFKLRKAYVAALKRCEEIIAGNPTFTRIDEVLFIAGESSLRLSESKGKQTAKDKTPEQLREDGREYLSELVTDYPESQFSKQALESLRVVGGVKKPAGAEKP